MIEHKVVDVRATGVMPAAVAESIEKAMNDCAKDGWELQLIQPMIYNSASTGYYLLIFRREAAGHEA